MGLEELSHKETCPICSAKYDFAFGKFRGRPLSGYDLAVCDTCYDMNFDGWNPVAEIKLLKHLSSKGIMIPKRNSKGFLPVEF